MFDPRAGLLKGRAGLDGDPDLQPAPARGLGVAAHPEVGQCGPVETGQNQGLVPGRVRAGVDIDQRERRLERLLETSRPGVDLERGLVAEPAQGCDPIGDQVFVRLAVFALVDPDLVP